MNMTKTKYIGTLMVLIIGLSLFNVPTMKAETTETAWPGPYDSMDEAWTAVQALLLPEMEEEFYDVSFTANAQTVTGYTIGNLLAPTLASSVDGNLAGAYAMAMGIPYGVNASYGFMAINETFNETYNEDPVAFLDGVTTASWTEVAANYTVFGMGDVPGIWMNSADFYAAYLAAAMTIDGENVTTANVSMIATYANATWADLTEVYDYLVTVFDANPFGAVDMMNYMDVYVDHMESEMGLLADYGVFAPGPFGGIFALGLVGLPTFNYTFTGNLAAILDPANGSAIANATGLAMWMNGTYDATLNATFGLAAGEFAMIYDYIMAYETSMAAQICGFFGIDTVPVAAIPSAIMLHQWLYGDVNWFPYAGDMGVQQVGTYLTPIFALGIDIGDGYELGSDLTAAGYPVTVGNESGITWAQAEMLWSYEDMYSFVYLQAEAPYYSVATMWTKAAMDKMSTEYSTLKDHFGLTETAMDYLLEWTAFWRKQWTIDNQVLMWTDSVGTWTTTFFYDQWILQDYWTGTTTSYGVTIPEGFNLDTSAANSSIDGATASGLFFKFNPLAFTNGNSTEGGLKLWLEAIDGNATSEAALMEGHDITAAQIAPLISWLDTFYGLYVDEPAVVVPTDDGPSIPGYSILALVGVSALVLSVLYKKRG